MIFYIFIFITSFILLFYSSSWLVSALSKTAQFLGWREFVFAFFAMAIAGALPNFFVAMSSILQGVPHLSVGEVLGGNIVDLTIAAALAAIISKNGLTVKSRTVQGTAIFTLIIAILPLILIHDRYLSRLDGITLLLAFIVYSVWLFSKQDRFTRVFDENKEIFDLKSILKIFITLIGSFAFLLLAAEGIVRSAVFFAESFNLPIILIGILIVGFGCALPETLFGIQAARKGEDWMVVGGLMGAVISISTLVLGFIALLSPIRFTAVDFSLLTVARVFLLIAAISFLLFIRTGNKITRREGIYLLILYLLFVFIQALII